MLNDESVPTRPTLSSFVALFMSIKPIHTLCFHTSVATFTSDVFSELVPRTLVTQGRPIKTMGICCSLRRRSIQLSLRSLFTPLHIRASSSRKKATTNACHLRSGYPLGLGLLWRKRLPLPAGNDRIALPVRGKRQMWVMAVLMAQREPAARH